MNYKKPSTYELLQLELEDDELSRPEKDKPEEPECVWETDLFGGGHDC